MREVPYPEMTDAMMDAGQRYLDGCVLTLSGRFTLPGNFNWHEFWRAMIDAGPCMASETDGDDYADRAEWKSRL